jgi:hypothetical protein
MPGPIIEFPYIIGGTPSGTLREPDEAEIQAGINSSERASSKGMFRTDPLTNPVGTTGVKTFNVVVSAAVADVLYVGIKSTDDDSVVRYAERSHAAALQSLALDSVGRPEASAVTGAVGSVTGAVGSVTGAVGSVAGDVGGKVLGGGAGTITGTGVRAVDGSGNAIAPAATALSTAQWTNARAGYLDNINVGGNVASSAEVTGIQNNTRVVRVVPSVIERPDSGSTVYRIELLAYDSAGNMEAPDSAPTLDVVDEAGSSRTGRLDNTTGTLVSTGRYRWEYTASDSDDLEQLVWAFSVVEGGATRVYGNTTIVVDTTAVDFTSADRTKLNAIHGKLPSRDYLAGSTASTGAIVDAVTVGTNNDKTGYALTTTPPTAAAIADAVWDEATAGHTSAGTFGAQAKTVLDTAAADVVAIDGAAPLTAQGVRDAMKLAPTVGAPAAGSVDQHLDDIEEAGGGGGTTAYITVLASTVSAGQVAEGAYTAYLDAGGSLVIAVVDQDSNPVALPASDLTFVVESTSPPRADLFTKTSVAGITVGGEDDNQATIVYTAADVDAVGGYRYALRKTSTGQVFARGKFSVVRAAAVDD